MVALLLFTLSACTLFNGIAGTQSEGTSENDSTLPSEEMEGIQDESGQDNLQDDGQSENSTEETTSAEGKLIKVKLYFPTEDNSALKAEEREVRVVEGAILKACINALMEGPETQGLRKTIPDGTKLLGISIKNNVATVDFSKEFLQTAGVEEIVTRLSVVNTLTEIDGVDKVRFHIQGEEMIGPSGMPLGAMGPVSLDKDGKPVAEEIKTVTLYFSDSDAMFVVPEKRQITLAKDEPTEKAVFIELMNGPESENLHATIPKGTKLLSIETKNGICTIDLSKEFVDNSPGGTASERMTISSVVNTLTELDGIKKVQFLIEGQKRAVYTHVVFDEPFERDESIIRK